MFNWSINLSDKQVLILIAFHTTEPDKDGNQFNAVRDLVDDAWDHRAIRKLIEDGLISAYHPERDPATARPAGPSIWKITDKGTLIALAILEDAAMIQQINTRAGLQARAICHTVQHSDWVEKKVAKRKTAS